MGVFLWQNEGLKKWLNVGVYFKEYHDEWCVWTAVRVWAWLQAALRGARVTKWTVIEWGKSTVWLTDTRTHTHTFIHHDERPLHRDTRNGQANTRPRRLLVTTSLSSGLFLARPSISCLKRRVGQSKLGHQIFAFQWQQQSSSISNINQVGTTWKLSALNVRALAREGVHGKHTQVRTHNEI